jgi:hypothetical protein
MLRLGRKTGNEGSAFVVEGKRGLKVGGKGREMVNRMVKYT